MTHPVNRAALGLHVRFLSNPELAMMSFFADGLSVFKTREGEEQTEKD